MKHGGAGSGRGGEQCVEVAIADRRRLIDDQHASGIEHAPAGCVSGEEHGDGFGFEAGVGGELLCGFCLDRSTDHPVPGGSPADGGSVHRGGLAGPGSTDGGLDPITRCQPGGDETALLNAELWIRCQRRVEVLAGHGAGAGGDAGVDGVQERLLR